MFNTWYVRANTFDKLLPSMLFVDVLSAIKFVILSVLLFGTG